MLSNDMDESVAKWVTHLTYNPLPPLVESGVKSVELHIRKMLLGNNLHTEELWQEQEARTIVNKQLHNGSWKYPTKQARSADENFNQYQTFKNLGVLVEQFGFNKTHPAIQKAAEYLFSFQTDEGDFRGIYDKQYTPNYSAGITELLIKAGYQDDAHIARVFKWLLAVRQQDGGWALPFRTQGYNIDVTYNHPTTIRPDITKPFSHMVTGVVLRAFAAHPQHKHSSEAKQAGELLVNNLFKRDNYPDRGTSKYWLQFTFPFCYTNLTSALDSLSLLGFSPEEPQIKRALQWFADKQLKTGIWRLKITAGKNRELAQLWLALAICKFFKRLYGN